MFEKLKSILKIFLKKLFNNFNTHNQIEYFINLLFEKLFKENLIYNILHDKLAAIKNYLKNAFEKN